MKIYDFNDNGANIAFDGLEGYSFTGDISISFLFQLEKWPVSWVNICQKKKNDNKNEFCFRIKNGSIAHWYYGNEDEVVVLAIDIKKYFKLYQWNKVSLIRKNKESLKVYINGELAGEKSIKSVGSPETSEAPLSIMGSHSNPIKIGAKIAEFEIVSKDNSVREESKKFILSNNLNLLSCIEGVVVKNSNLTESKFRVKNTLNGSFKDLNHFELDEALKKGSIDSIELGHFGKFGNSIKQLLNCMTFADHYKIKKVYIPAIWYLKESKSFTVNNIEVVLKGSDKNAEDENVFVNQFFYLRRYFKLSGIESYDYSKAYTRFKDMMIFEEEDWNVEPLDSNELVVYFRSGDIFHEPHPGYGQPPLSFYKKIIKSRQWSKVSCVYQDKSNPVIQPFIEYVSNLNIDIREVSGSLEDDIKFLLSSINLVAAPGTFTWSISLISENLKNVFYFNEIEVINFSEIRLNEIKFYDLSGRYIKSIMSNNWKNTMSQRELMLTYPEDEILLS